MTENEILNLEIEVEEYNDERQKEAQAKFDKGPIPKMKWMMDQIYPPHGTIRVSGTHLFERESSAHIPPATALVEKARAYIAEHACEGIRVDDVVSSLGVSRSLLDLRFRQVCGKSVLEEILNVRLAEVRRRLSKTDQKILQIGRDCGFSNPDNLKRLFRKRFGCTMREWRNGGR